MRRRRFIGPECALIDDRAWSVEKKQNPKGVPKSVPSLSSFRSQRGAEEGEAKCAQVGRKATPKRTMTRWPNY